MAEAKQKFKIIDNPSVGELYANKLITASFDGGAVAITLGTSRFLPEQGGESPSQDKPWLMRRVPCSRRSATFSKRPLPSQTESRLPDPRFFGLLQCGVANCIFANSYSLDHVSSKGFGVYDSQIGDCKIKVQTTPVAGPRNHQECTAVS
jgi:hypothetical protein